ncbi:pyruvate kinase [Haloarcula quadrata]|uniref:Pyruvate kinase n=3 Tax=Haloarcula TaxID=2237 RepID=A0A495R521_9EURY|nr:pyruvate kinase [Haloarcula quadrata]
MNAVNCGSLDAEVTMRSAKIVCTLGPASDSVDDIASLAKAGMSVARLNASHGSPEHRREMIDRIRQVDEAVEEPVAAMLDMPGPEVRTAEIDEPIQLTEGSTIRYVVGDDATPEEVGLSQSITAVEPGDRVLLDDGRIETTVERVEDETVFAAVENGGELAARKGVNVPGVELDLPTITENDEQELDVAAEKEPDFVAASFVRDGEDIYEISQALEERGVDIPIIAKIERAGAVENLDSIIDEAYGVMVARGDLGVECPLEDVPIIQKRTIRRCHEAGVPVITATEMLDSMVHSRRPTRAEASDVANAVLDGTDAVMLSGETAIGDHPTRVVETMDRIIRDVEGSEEYAESREQRVPNAGDTRTDALARSGRFLARDIGASAIVAASESGYTALKSAKYRPSIPIVASTPSERVRRKLALSWGITPVTTEYTTEGADAVIQTAVQAALDTEAADSGDTVVVLSGMMTELEGMNTANMLKVHVAAETVASGRSIVDGLVTGPVHRISTAPPRESPGDLSNVPEGAILAVPEGFDGEFVGDTSRIGGIIDGHEGVTSYAAIVARELSIPMISNADLPDAVSDGSTVTLDSERGVVYEESVGREDISGRERDY